MANLPLLDNSQNPLQNAAKTLLPDQSGPQARPQGWFLNDSTKTPNVPADEPKQKFFCSVFRSHNLISRKQFLRFCRGHLRAVLTNGDFVLWYARNAGKLAKRAEARGFNWSTMKPLAIDRTEEIYASEGFQPALQNYMHFCDAMYRLFGLQDPEIEPFRNSFYFSSRSEKGFGSFRLAFHKGAWRDLILNLRMQWRWGKI